MQQNRPNRLYSIYIRVIFVAEHQGNKTIEERKNWQNAWDATDVSYQNMRRYFRNPSNFFPEALHTFLERYSTTTISDIQKDLVQNTSKQNPIFDDFIRTLSSLILISENLLNRNARGQDTLTSLPPNQSIADQTAIVSSVVTEPTQKEDEILASFLSHVNIASSYIGEIEQTFNHVSQTVSQLKSMIGIVKENGERFQTEYITKRQAQDLQHKIDSLRDQLKDMEQAQKAGANRLIEMRKQILIKVGEWVDYGQKQSTSNDSHEGQIIGSTARDLLYMIDSQLNEVYGLTSIPIKPGDRFDPSRMNIYGTEHIGQTDEPGTVAEVREPGYWSLKGNVVFQKALVVEFSA